MPGIIQENVVLHTSIKFNVRAMWFTGAVRAQTPAYEYCRRIKLSGRENAQLLIVRDLNEHINNKSTN